MKYTKKQIEKGFLNWETQLRLHPENFSTTEEELIENVETLSKNKTEALIKFINQDENK